jgi:hypothetical protein
LQAMTGVARSRSQGAEIEKGRQPRPHNAYLESG